MVYLVAGLAVGLLVGLVAGFLAADWVQDNAKRKHAGALTARQRLELARLEPAQERGDYDTPAYLRRSDGERALPSYPYQPPVIVLAAPRAQGPQVVAPGTAVTRY